MMAGQYTAFLNNPTTSLLAADASLVYITTTTEIKEPNAIIKHLQAQQNQTEKKGEKILNVIASPDGACLETETTLQFKAGGGAYLPGMDENLLDEKIVTFPVMHIVRFDAEQKIKQIRLYWDQGTLLKQVEAIGKTGRNWPIKDGQAQVNAINKSLNAGGRNTDVNGTAAPAARGPHDVVISEHKKRDSVSATRDPHASLALFAPRDPNEQSGPRQFEGPKTAPRESYKAPHRGLNDILSGEDIAQTGFTVRNPSPIKTDGFYPKAGAGKHHVNNRLFDENEPSGPTRSPERKKVFKEKNNHFEFGDGEDAPEPSRPMSARGSKNQNTQIDFAAFSVSPSVQDKTRPDYDRHWGDGVQPDDPSPVKRPIKHAPRLENESHFSLANSSPAAAHEKQKSLHRQKGMGLYQDPLHADERTAVRPQTETNNTRRGNDFAPHHNMNDASPSAANNAKDNSNKNAGTNMSAYARGDLDSNWDFGTPVQEKKIYKTAGNGMGGREAELGSGKRKRVREDIEGACVTMNDDPTDGEGEASGNVVELKDGYRKDSVIPMQEVSVNVGKKQKTVSEPTKAFSEEGTVELNVPMGDDDGEPWALIRRSQAKGVAKV